MIIVFSALYIDKINGFIYMKVGLPEKVIFLEGFSGKQSFISSYNKGHKLFIIPKLHTQQNILKTNLTFNSHKCIV
jgi:hypothetical protein